MLRFLEISIPCLAGKISLRDFAALCVALGGPAAWPVGQAAQPPGDPPPSLVALVQSAFRYRSRHVLGIASFLSNNPFQFRSVALARWLDCNQKTGWLICRRLVAAGVLVKFPGPPSAVMFALVPEVCAACGADPAVPKITPAPKIIYSITFPPPL